MYDDKVVLTEEEKVIAKTAQRAIEVARESVWEMFENKRDITTVAFHGLVGPLASAIFTEMRKNGK